MYRGAALLALACACGLWRADAANPSRKASAAPEKGLQLLERIPIKSIPASAFVGTITCDSDGNIYFRAPHERPNLNPVMKVNPLTGDRVTFDPSRVPDVTLWTTRYYAIDSSGHFYQLATGISSPNQKIEDIYVLEFDKDGTYASRIKLDVVLKPAQIAVFRNGQFLVTGVKVDLKTWGHAPFSGIFDSTGKLLREVSLKDDAKIQAMEKNADPAISDPLHPTVNRAIFLGEAVTGADGNVYLMRRLAPAIIYSIDPAGEVTNRLEVSSGHGAEPPGAMLASGQRIVVQFWADDIQSYVYKIVDASTGQELGSYADRDLGGALTCYNAENNRFTFLSSDEQGLLEVDIAQPK